MLGEWSGLSLEIPRSFDEVPDLVQAHQVNCIVAQQYVVQHYWQVEEQDSLAWFGRLGVPVVMLMPTYDQQIEMIKEVGVRLGAQPLFPCLFIRAMKVALGIEDYMADRLSALPKLDVPKLNYSGQVLVAEDHPTNQQVIKQQMKLLGVNTTLVENGVEALKAWRTGKFDLVITDCHMPEMDGYTLARTIREEEQRLGMSRIPIIALTAIALADDAQKCRACGMDDFITKPVAIPSLGKILRYWLGKAVISQREATEETAELSEESQDAPIHINQLISLFGDQALVSKMLNEFISQTQRDVGQLLKSIETHQANEVAETAHRIKGASKIIEAGGLAENSLALELAAKGQDWSSISHYADEVNSEFSHLQHYVKEKLK